MLIKTIKLLLTVSIFISVAFPVLAIDDPTNSNKELNIYFFWANGCPHCAKEKPFLDRLEQKYPTLTVHSFEVTKSKENLALLKKLGDKLKTDVSGVPFTVVGNQYFSGWYDENITGTAIEKAIQNSLQNNCPDIVSNLITPENCDTQNKDKTEIPDKINLPIFGKIQIKNFSLPAITIIFGALDGFNPCAMWVLLFLISMLIGLKDKKRRWILGSAFIIASAGVYFLFMTMWLNLLLFLGFVIWIRFLIALVALGGGIYNLREYKINKDAACKVTAPEKRRKVFNKLKSITQKKQFWLALGGIIILAAAVNVVELICSAGLPTVYTQILALNNLARWQNYFYILLYIFIFMLDDLIVFFIAMVTLEITGLTNKYSRFSHLIGGILMVIIGLLLIFKPDWLMFG